MHKVPQVLIGDSILAGQFGLTRAIGNRLTDVLHVLLFELGVAVSLALRGSGAKSGASRVAIAALAGAVGIVLGNRAEEQVSRVAAGPVVTPMAYAKAGRNVSVDQRVSHAVRGEARPVGKREYAVTANVLGSLPIPASGLLTDVDLRPKARAQF